MSGKRRAAPLPQLPSEAQPALSPSASASVSFPRSTSPSGITQFFSKPTKWFTRSASSPKLQGPGSSEPRASTSSTTRKPKISRPTDPRPILDSYSSAGSRSFQDRVQQYRNRSGSASAAVAPQVTPRPIPSPSRSLVPPPSQHPPVAISVSAPTLDDAPIFSEPIQSGEASPSHSRTYSFAPKLSSRLARMPPSPSRKGSGSSDRDVAWMERDLRSTALLSPPTESPDPTPKRSSQVMYHSGFVNRLTDFVPPTNENATPHLGRGWKAYKAELRGARLLFFKPPSDRAGEIKALFPTTIVAPGDDEDDEDAGDEGLGDALSAQDTTNSSGTGGAQETAEEVKPQARRRRRAYWGRGPHPDLARAADGSVQGGTMEALLHEAVFASTTGGDAQPDSAESAGGSTSYDAARRAFATAVLVALPSLVGRARVEVELLRCCQQFVEGCEENAQEEAKERVSWIAKEYIRLHGAVRDRAAWEALVPGLCEGQAGEKKGEEEQGEGERPGPETFSPHIGTFSPRPAAEGPSMHDALDMRRTRAPSDSSPPSKRSAGPPPPIQTHPAALDVPSSPRIPSSPMRSRTPSSPSAVRGPTSPIRTRSPSSPTTTPWPSSPRKDWSAPEPTGVWGALANEGLSRSVLLALDPALLARSLTVFHGSALSGASGELTAGVILGEDGEEEPAGSQASSSPTARSPKASPMSETKLMFGSDDAPHWLTKLVLLQVLSADAGSGPSIGHGDFPQQQHHGATLAVPVSPSTPRRSLDGRPSMQRTLSSSPPNSQSMPSRPHTSGAPQSPRQHAPSSRTHTRSEVISVWARVGELCRQAGDEVSWRAIMAGLCARPVARLEKAWKRADPQAISAVESWVYGLGGGPHVAEHGSTTAGGAVLGGPLVTVWGGDARMAAKEQIDKLRAKAGDGEGASYAIAPLQTVRKEFELLRQKFTTCPREPISTDEEDVRRMVNFWTQAAAEGGGAGGIAAKFQRVEQFMSLSLAAEPRRKGLFEPYFWQRPSGQQPPHNALLPLLFPEALPTVSLVDRSQVVRGRVDSDASDFLFLKGFDDQLRPEDRRGKAKFLEDMVGGTNGISALSQGGTVIPVHGGELLLVVQKSSNSESYPPSRASSRPPTRASSRPPSSTTDHGSSTDKSAFSRAPSIRVKPGASAGLDRKTSVARRNSLPSLSTRRDLVTADKSSEPPLRVLVRAGTLNHLVDILVHGLHHVSVSVTDDNGEMTLKEGMTRELYVDRAEFARVWWNVFRTFLTPIVFFELLRKEYIKFQPRGSPPSAEEYLLAIDLRSEVIDTMREWLCCGNGSQDVLDDNTLYHAFHDFLLSDSDHMSIDVKIVPEEVARAFTKLERLRESLQATFESQIMRPSHAHAHPQMRPPLPTSGSRQRHVSGRGPLDIDAVEPEELVDELDAMAAAAFSNVTEEDLYVTADLLEVQSADRTGWFLPKDSTATEDTVEIQSMHTVIHEVEASSMISELTQDTLYRLLPPGIRSCIRAHLILRKWIVSKIVAPRLGLKARQSRIELLLRALEVCRLRNLEGRRDISIAQSHCVRSFAEATITSAIISVESRAHWRAWNNVAMNRSATCDSLVSLLAVPAMHSVTDDMLTVDIGWLFERMLEIIVSPDILDSVNADSQGLINFDKRRHLCSILNNAPNLFRTRNAHRDDFTRRNFDRLNAVETEVAPLLFDLRGIKEEAAREAMQASASASGKRVVRPFQKLVSAQIEKNRRDKGLRIRMQREKQQEQTRSEKRDDQLTKAMKPRKLAPAPLPKHARNKKSMSSLFNFMRPISSAFGADLMHSPGVKRTAAELDFTPSSKPAMAVNLAEARVMQFINTERSYTFQLETEDGGHYLLQALSRKEMTKWVDTINKVAKITAKRRLTYIGNSPKPQIADHLHADPLPAGKGPRAVFGVDLDELLRREAGGEDVTPGSVPSIIDRCISEIEARGLTEVGIYRIAGAVSEINALKEAFNRGESPIKPHTDIHAVCDVVKSWLRVLPDPVFPHSLYHEVIEATQLESLDDRIFAIRGIIHRLSQSHYDLLKRIVEHLDKVADYEEHNQMTAEALAIVFSPNLLRAPQNDFSLVLANMGHSNKLVKTLLTHMHAIFAEPDEADMEGEPDEDDLESAIIEEEDEDYDEEEEKRLSVQNYVTVDDEPPSLGVPIPDSSLG
ncbi:rho GTPase activating protein 22 [Schizophyllum commune]